MAFESRNWTNDIFVRVVIGLGVALLAVLILSGFLVDGRDVQLPRLVWLVPTVQAFITIAAASVALLCIGRYQALGGAWTFWAGLVFVANCVLGLFYLLAWPGLVGDRGVIGQLPNTAGWLFLLAYSTPALIGAAALARRPTYLGSTRQVAAYALAAVLSTLVGVLSLIVENGLPLVVEGDAFTPLTQVWQAVLVVLFAAAAIALLGRYLQ
ncbi:MAG: hypothetical protein HYX94_13315 [Chloroflexi bacterium]|nr:hypothetical protein [Chloroflexota bacterium]